VPSASTADGTNLQQWACLEPAQDHQLWKFVPASGSPGYFEIKAKHSNKCIDVLNAGTSNGAAVKQHTCGGQVNQRWSLRSVDVAEPPLIDAGFESLLRNWDTAGVGEVVPAVVNSDWRTGTHSANFKLTGSQDRSELILGGEGNANLDLPVLFTEGDEYYYGFAFKILSMTYGKAGAHNLIMQFKSDEDEGSEDGPNFGLQLWNYEGNKGLWTNGAGAMGEKTRFLSEVSEKQWHDVVIHFVASSTGEGSYELYLDGVKIDSKENVSMIVPGREFAYIKNGLYRNGGTNPGTSEILLDNAKLGTTFASVSE
jgi:Polysaccharide lyase/Ricin-type beta-trefoil lectin domain-like